MTETTRRAPRGTGTLARVLEQPPRWLAVPIRTATFVELALGAVAVIVIFVLVLVQAGQRYLPIDGWPWTGELARYSLVWLTFLVAGVLVSRDAHVAIEMVDSVPSEWVARVARVVSSLIVAAVGVGLTAAAWELTQEGSIRSPAMQMPMSWFHAISMLGFISTTIRALVAAVRYAVLGAPVRNTEDVLASRTQVAVE